MEAERPEKKAKASSRKGTKAKSTSKGGGDAVGQVLRSVYSKAVQEDIPMEMLDLLNKLD